MRWFLSFSEWQPEHSPNAMRKGLGEVVSLPWNSSSQLAWSHFLGARLTWKESRDGLSLGSGLE